MSKNVELGETRKEEMVNFSVLCLVLDSWLSLFVVIKEFFKLCPVELCDKDCVRKVRMLKCVEVFF